MAVRRRRPLVPPPYPRRNRYTPMLPERSAPPRSLPTKMLRRELAIGITEIAAGGPAGSMRGHHNTLPAGSVLRFYYNFLGSQKRLSSSLVFRSASRRPPAIVLPHSVAGGSGHPGHHDACRRAKDPIGKGLFIHIPSSEETALSSIPLSGAAFLRELAPLRSSSLSPHKHSLVCGAI